MKISLSIFLGLALVAGAIYYKPTEPSLSCSTGACGFLKGKHMIVLYSGSIKKFNTETGIYSVRTIREAR
jgi:hypothetical protein